MIVQTSATAFAWYSILHYAYPERTKWRDILAGYAVSVALNGILPANIGTLVFLIMVTVLLGIGFAAVLGAYAVEKIFFTCSGHLRVPLSLPPGQRLVRHLLQLGARALARHDHRLRRWHPDDRAAGPPPSGRMSSAWWQNAKEGGAILGVPAGSSAASFFRRSSAGARCSPSIGVFLNAYGIPGQLRHADARRRRELARQRHLVHPRRASV
jgi:hypothetical protein